jgi:hypothetical protein
VEDVLRSRLRIETADASSDSSNCWPGRAGVTGAAWLLTVLRCSANREVGERPEGLYDDGQHPEDPASADTVEFAAVEVSKRGGSEDELRRGARDDERPLDLTEALKAFLGATFAGHVEPFLSAEDIAPGERFTAVIAEILESWDPGILESWNPGILESWNPGILESWNPGILESWNPGIVRPRHSPRDAPESDGPMAPNPYVAKPGKLNITQLVGTTSTSGGGGGGGGESGSGGGGTTSAIDKRYSSCTELLRHANHAPYGRGVDPEYAWYQDRDHDGWVCE